jgi:hypothetical protein
MTAADEIARNLVSLVITISLMRFGARIYGWPKVIAFVIVMIALVIILVISVRA